MTAHRSGWVVTGTLVTVLAMQLPRLAATVSDQVGATSRDVAVILRADREERKLLTYGDRDRWGYGYLEEVVERLPDDGSVPVIRTGPGRRAVGDLLPGYRRRLDRRLIVGIGVGEDEMRPAAVARATPVPGRPAEWTFTTGRDCDLLVGVRIEARGAPFPAGTTVNVSVFPEPTADRGIGQWQARTPVSTASIEACPDEPLQAVSIHRGATPFLLRIDVPGGAPPIGSVLVVGQRVDLRHFRIVHRSGACWTAVEESFLASLRARHPPEWRRFEDWLR